LQVATRSRGRAFVTNTTHGEVVSFAGVNRAFRPLAIEDCRSVTYWYGDGVFSVRPATRQCHTLIGAN
jgi:hypothetical protein